MTTKNISEAAPINQLVRLTARLLAFVCVISLIGLILQNMFG